MEQVLNLDEPIESINWYGLEIKFINKYLSYRIGDSLGYYTKKEVFKAMNDMEPIADKLTDEYKLLLNNINEKLEPGKWYKVDDRKMTMFVRISYIIEIISNFTIKFKYNDNLISIVNKGSIYTDLIDWLLYGMHPGKPYNVTQEQVEKIKNVWHIIHKSKKYEWVFNEKYTQIKKREL